MIQRILLIGLDVVMVFIIMAVAIFADFKFIELGIGLSHIVLLPAIIICFLLADRKGGLIAMLLSILSTWYFFMGSTWSFELQNTTEAISLLTFILIVVFISAAFNDRQHKINQLLQLITRIQAQTNHSNRIAVSESASSPVKVRNQIETRTAGTSPLHYQICKRCIMDTTTNLISFDENGICNFCNEALKEIQLTQSIDKSVELRRLTEKIRYAGRGSRYDCVLGLSGGLDSSYVAYLVKHEMGLRPLAIHIDNGWDSELAVKNIEEIVHKLDIELETDVLNWAEFRSLQYAFLKSGTPDLEIPTDHAIFATLYKVAVKEKVPYAILGTNLSTESIMPKDWSYGHFDWKYISSINRLFGDRPLNSFPHLSLFNRVCRSINWRVRTVQLLNLVDYDKKVAQDLLSKKFGWKPYQQKHFESSYTKFFQAVVLPKKFGIDKRKAHFSSLICSGQMTRDAALAEIQQLPIDEDEVEPLTEYVAKKLNISDEELHNLIKLPNMSFHDYPNEEDTFYWPILRKLQTTVLSFPRPREPN